MNVGFIDDEAEQRRAKGVYERILKCKCGNVLVAAELPEGDGKCVCGKTYHKNRAGVAWIEPRPDRGGGVVG